MVFMFPADRWYNSLCNIMTKNFNKEVDSYLLLCNFLGWPLIAASV